MSQNVQQYGKDVYLRASEAQQCQIQSTIVLPLFDSQLRRQSIGVMEVVQTASDMPFGYVMSTLDEVLKVGKCRACCGRPACRVVSWTSMGMKYAPSDLLLPCMLQQAPYTPCPPVTCPFSGGRLVMLYAALQGCRLWTCRPESSSREMSESSDTVRAIADKAGTASSQVPLVLKFATYMRQAGRIHVQAMWPC